MSNSFAISEASYGDDTQAMQQYLADGDRRARAMNNRGPIRFDENGCLHADIVSAYSEYGFYVFTGVLRSEELQDIESDFHEEIMHRLPVSKGARVDARGRPAIGIDCEAPTLFWSRPLGDPFGGTDKAGGRHPIKMTEPTPTADSPDEIVYLILGSLQFSEALLRTYGHPQLLGVAAAIHGDDFVPFNEALFIKAPGLGASVAWHQDGLTHWDSPQWDEGIHGFNFMGQLYGCTAANGVWVLPGSHRRGKVDIKALVQQAGSERLPDAVPMVCDAGDVVISNRQIVHGSFANVSEQWRVTVNMGFHRRASVLNVVGGGLHNAEARYDEERIGIRSRVLGYAIDARAKRFPDEQPFVYQPFIEQGLSYQWDASAKSTMRDYNLLDLSI